MKLQILLFPAALTLLTSACDEAPSRQGAALVQDEADREALGKADIALEGLCADPEEELACGGPAAVGNCWCDEACERYGDCCVDAFDACGVGEPQPAVSQCLADSHCEEGQQCAGGVCIEVAPPVDCNDGTALSPFCDIKPLCDEGQTAAIIGACFQCVDAQTCA